MNKPYLTVVIPSFNRQTKLKTCLERLQNQTLAREAFEVIVVNDGSSDETESFLDSKMQSWPELKVIHQVNSGQGIARNKAIKMAEGQITMFIGDDIYATENFLQEHVDFHQENPKQEMACLGLTEWDKEQEVTPYMEWLTHGGHQFAYHKLTADQEAGFWFFYTSNISLKTELLQTDNFDTDFGGYGWEDMELGYRLEKKGLKLIYKPKALAYHDHFMEPSSLKSKMEKIYSSAQVFQNKHPEIKVIPTGFKRFAFWLLSNPLNLAVLSIFGGPLYWYALSKRYTLKYT